MKRFFILLSMAIGFLISGCDSAQVKQEIQTKYKISNPNGDKGFCLFFAAPESYPYTSTHTPPPIGSGLQVSMNNNLNKKLHIYAQIGMFTEEPTGEDAGKPIYRYGLTPLGEQYFYRSSQFDAFCFGKIIVNDVVIGNARENSLGQMTKSVTVKYHVENIPDWVSNNYELLATISRSYFKDLLNNGSYPSAAELIKIPNGWALGKVEGGIMY